MDGAENKDTQQVSTSNNRDEEHALDDVIINVDSSAASPGSKPPKSEKEHSETAEKNGIAQSEEQSTGTAAAASDTSPEDTIAWYHKAWAWWTAFYGKNSFLILVIIAVLLAYAYPPLGAVYLQPQITATWIAVVFIFVLAGLGLKTEEFKKAFQRIWFNLFVQCYNFFVVSAIVFGFSRLLYTTKALDLALANGMVICASLPITVNMVLVLTKSGGGDEAAAVFNAAFGNMTGVFLTPVLILGYLGVDGDIDLLTVFYKLALRVVVPIFVGQICQKFVPPVVKFVKTYKPYFKKVQEWCLVFIVYTVFCKTFLNGSDATATDAILMIALQFVLLCFTMALAWLLLKLLFRNKPKLRVMGLFGCTHKTVAMGVPLINAIYEDNPNVGLYTLPLLVWHPMQLFIGTFLAPKLAAFVEKEQERLTSAKQGDKEEEQRRSTIKE